MRTTTTTTAASQMDLATLVGPPRFARTHQHAPEPLTGGDLIEWLMLSRVNAGLVAAHGEQYRDHGIPVPWYLLPALCLDVMRAIDMITVHRRADGSDVLSLTPAGRVRLDELRRRRNLPGHRRSK